MFDQFYNRGSTYNYETGTGGDDYFKQLLWKTNTEMAVSLYTKPSTGKTYINFYFYPGIYGEATENLFKYGTEYVPEVEEEFNPTKGMNLTQFNLDELARHNELRRLHVDTPDLVLNQTCIDHAQVKLFYLFLFLGLC